ncbi:MAG: hypothetical protein SGJ10_10655 [Bacteroidota bacterium]|nr:hypothetical protein [Bacteroidota bacterium]
MFGTFCLPAGNFSAIVDLPKMYEHCKATEDKDMTPFDFVTDHLINIDGLFDMHEDGDEQKPHSPVQLHCLFAQISIVTQQFLVSVAKPINFKSNIPIYTENFYYSEYYSFVFRPPIF